MTDIQKTQSQEIVDDIRGVLASELIDDRIEEIRKADDWEKEKTIISKLIEDCQKISKWTDSFIDGKEEHRPQDIAAIIDCVNPKACKYYCLFTGLDYYDNFQKIY